MKHITQDAWRGVALEFKSEQDETDPLKAINELGTTLESKFQSLNSEWKATTDRIDAEIAKLKRPGTTESKSEDSELESKAWSKFLRKGQQALTADELKHLQTSDDTDGGFLAPESYVAELLRNIVQWSPVRQYARVATISTGAAVLPSRDSGFTAQWVGENEDRPETNAKFGQHRFTVNELSCYVDVSNQLREDAAFSIDDEVRFEFAEEMGRAEGEAMIRGNGVNRPNGLLGEGSHITYVPTGHASQITPDSLITLFNAVPSFYRASQSCVFMASTAAITAIRKLKDGNGNWLIQPAGLAGAPVNMLLGKPLVEAPDLDDPGSDKFPVLFGDFAQYRIFDRIALAVQVDPFTQNTKGRTRYLARRRLAAGVGKAEAFRVLKCATS